jgi:hypothetical protein
MRGESPRGLDTELYGETNEKDSWGPHSLWLTRRFRVNSRGVGQPERLVLGPQPYAARCVVPLRGGEELPEQFF